MADENDAQAQAPEEPPKLPDNIDAMLRAEDAARQVDGTRRLRAAQPREGRA